MLLVPTFLAASLHLSTRDSLQLNIPSPSKPARRSCPMQWHSDTPTLALPDDSGIAVLCSLYPGCSLPLDSGCSYGGAKQGTGVV